MHHPPGPTPSPSGPSPRRPAPWSCPAATGPVSGWVQVPGSKSMSNRALVIAALATGPVRVRGLLASRDSALMVRGLIALGAQVEDDGDGVVVHPIPPHGATDAPAAGRRVDCGLAGTVMRFLPPLAALVDGPTTFDGDAQARLRPMGGLLDGLSQLGVAVDAPTGGLPFTVHGDGRLVGGTVTIDAAASSQFVSGLLLAGAAAEAALVVKHRGGPLPSVPHIDMTVAMLRAAGVDAAASGSDTWTVAPGRPSCAAVQIEPDLANALPFIAAALLTGGEVGLTNLGCAGRASVQAVERVAALVTALGGTVTHSERGMVVRGTARVTALDADLRDVGELVPTLAALAVFADGPSRLRGIGHLRGHETDRLAALATELGRVGARVTVEADGLTIVPGPPRPGALRAYADHRMATAAALIGLRIPGVTVDDIGATTKTMPDFATRWPRFVAGHAAAAGRADHEGVSA